MPKSKKKKLIKMSLNIYIKKPGVQTKRHPKSSEKNVNNEVWGSTDTIKRGEYTFWIIW